MSKAKRTNLSYEFLEQRALLSGVGHAAKGHVHAEAIAARHEAKVAAQVATTSPVTGGGLLSVGPAPSNGDIQSMQQVAVSNNLVMFLTQLDELSGTNATIQQVSSSILNDARNLDLAMWNLANSLGVNLPADIEGGDIPIAQQATSAVRGGSFDQAYLGALSEAGSSMATQLQQIATGAQNAAIQSFAATALPIVQADMAAAQAAAGGSTSAIPAPLSASPSSTTVLPVDLSSLEMSYSMNLTERFLAQFTNLVDGNVRIQQYDDKLINDHEMMAVQEGMYAAATGTYLPASIQGMDISDSLKLINASARASYNRVYLRQMVQMHTVDLSLNETTLATTQNPVIRGFASVGMATDVMHRQGARNLLSGFRL